MYLRSLGVGNTDKAHVVNFSLQLGLNLRLEQLLVKHSSLVFMKIYFEMMAERSNLGTERIARNHNDNQHIKEWLKIRFPSFKIASRQPFLRRMTTKKGCLDPLQRRSVVYFLSFTEKRRRGDVRVKVYSKKSKTKISALSTACFCYFYQSLPKCGSAGELVQGAAEITQCPKSIVNHTSTFA